MHAACTPAPTGIVAWWPGEANATDIVGTNNGVLDGTVGFAAGEVGQSFRFTTTNADVKVLASPSLNVGAASGFTLEAWINPSNLAVARNPLFEWNNGAGSWGVHFYVIENAQLDANIVDSGTFWHQITSGAGVVTSNVFQHVALTYDKSSGVATIYRNGVIVAQQNLGTFTPLTTYNFYLGRRVSASVPTEVFTFSGLIDEPSIYNRALTTTEIAAIFTAGSAGKCSPNHPPVAGSTFTLGVDLSVPTSVKIIGGKHPPTDVDNDKLVITSVSGATNGVTSTDGTNVTYTATGGALDSFVCTISDGRDGTAQQTVNVIIGNNGGLGYNQLTPQSLGGGTNLLTFLGTPGFKYALEKSTNLVPPVIWLPLLTNPAAANGWLFFTNVTSNSPVFYRTRYVP
jgi:hypothetical protein